MTFTHATCRRECRQFRSPKWCLGDRVPVFLFTLSCYFHNAYCQCPLTKGHQENICNWTDCLCYFLQCGTAYNAWRLSNFSIAVKRIMTKATNKRAHLTGDIPTVQRVSPWPSDPQVWGRHGKGRTGREEKRERGEERGKGEKGEERGYYQTPELGELIHLLGLLKEVEMIETAVSPKAHPSMGDGSWTLYTCSSLSNLQSPVQVGECHLFQVAHQVWTSSK